MKQVKGNPSSNKLPQGMDEESLQEAVERSGYPLQAVAATTLARHLNVAEEWSYIDRETKHQRSLDLFCYKELVQRDEHKLTPTLMLLVECKRSELPYIFFKATVQRRWPDIPRILGLPVADLELQRGDRLLNIPLGDSLQLWKHAFFLDGPPISSSFTRASRKGRGFKLTGADPFNRIVMPLVSALEHASAYYAPSHISEHYYIDLPLCVCVLDAPLIVAEGGPEQAKLSLAPWVRVIRQEVTAPRPGWRAAERNYAIEVVHRDFLEVFLTEQLTGLASAFAERSLALESVLHAGKGSLLKEGDWDWTDIVERV